MAFAILAASCRPKDKVSGIVFPKQISSTNVGVSQVDNYRFDIYNDTKTDMTYRGNDFSMGNTTDIGLVCSLWKDSSKHSFVKVTYKKMIIELHNKEFTQKIDAASSDTSDILTRIFRPFIGSSIQISLDSADRIVQLSGAEELRNRILASARELDEPVRKIIEQQTVKMTGLDFFQRNLRGHLEIFPDSSIRIDDRWTRNEETNDDLHLTTVAKYRLTNIKDSLAEITMDGSVASASQQATNLNGSPVKVDVTGKQNAFYSINFRSGMLRSSTVISDLSGNVEVLGETVPVKIKVKKEIHSARL